MAEAAYAASSPRHRPPRATFVIVGSGMVARPRGAPARTVVVAVVQGTRLSHALDRPNRYVATDEMFESRTPQPGITARFRACQFRRPRRPASDRGRGSYGPNFRENWVSVDRDADSTCTLANDRRQAVSGYPGLYRDVQTYLGNASRRWTGHRRNRRRTGLRRRPPSFPAHAVTRDRSRAPAPTLRAWGICTSELAHDGTRRCEVQRRPDAAARYGLKPGDVRRARRLRRRHRGARHLDAGRRAIDVIGLRTPGDPRLDRRQHRRAADRHTLWRPARCDSTTSLTCVKANARKPIRRENGSRRIDIHRNVTGRGRRRHRRGGQRQSLSALNFRSGTRKGLGEHNERQRAPSSFSRSGRSSWSPSCCCCTPPSARLAPRRLIFSPTLAGALVGGGTRGTGRRRRHLARVARRHLHRVRHRRTQRHHADPPLPPSRARRARSRSAGPRAARGAASGCRRS